MCSVHTSGQRKLTTFIEYIDCASANDTCVVGKDETCLDEEPVSPLLGPEADFSESYLKLRSNSTFCNCAITLVTLLGFMMLVFWMRDYIHDVLRWVEGQQTWLICLIFIGLFTLVSFPFMWGYILINLACGYLFGIVHGIFVVITTASLGVLVAHLIIKFFFSDFVRSKFAARQSTRALIAVVSGPLAFRVVAFTRLTPIPFGIQNAIFTISCLPVWKYMAATMLGLLPTQVINVYLGSTLRSMEDVLSDRSTAVTGYTIFAIQVLLSVLLMVYVVKRAKAELRKSVQQLSSYSDKELNSINEV